MGCQPPVSYADNQAIGELLEPLRSRIYTLIHDAPRHGLVLISGYRTPWEQWLLRHERCPGRECDRSCKGNPITALPYESQHQKRLAADLGGTQMLWAHANAPRYGTSAEVVPSENWHHEARGTPTVRIIPYGEVDPPTDPNAGREWVGFGPGDTDASIYRRGGLSNEVSEIQFRLNMLSGRLRKPEMNTGVGDGVYGSKTQHGVMVFKVWVIYLQRATGQEPEWSPHITPMVGEKFIAMLRWWTPG